ncbi:MAG: hypothetical protein JW829_05785 [Pirellulales bacterium]|nr:hypothetical protein [Pirellulales bacterium]
MVTTICGDTVSAIWDGVEYQWTISHTGDISWSDPDQSIVDSILGPGNGTDVVLIGLGSGTAGGTAIPEPLSFALLLILALGCYLRSRN